MSETVQTNSLPVGILNDEAIRSEIKAGRLITGATENNIQACSYDMRIGTIFRRGVPVKTAPAQGEDIQVQPGEVVSLFTLEELNLPADIAAVAFAINEMSSQGLLVLNPGHIDPGFRGPLTVRAINIRKNAKAINFGTKIFTVIFERLPAPAVTPYSTHPTRDEREQSFAGMDLEQNPGSLTNLIVGSRDFPFATPVLVDEKIRNFVDGEKVNQGLISAPEVDDKIVNFFTAQRNARNIISAADLNDRNYVNEAGVNELIRNHWIGWVTMACTIIAALAAIVAVIVTLIPSKDNTKQPPAGLERTTDKQTISAGTTATPNTNNAGSPAGTSNTENAAGHAANTNK
jgi:deoxycytidine triphosphate deaminase